MEQSPLNPYAAQPDFTFWRRAVSGRSLSDIDPVVEVPFRISVGDQVATAGSCFAQHISRTLIREGLSYLVTEPAPGTRAAVNEGYGVFPARFGNVYTVRQLLQLFLRAYGVFEPVDRVWLTEGGQLIDPFRPRIQQGGFATVSDLEADRAYHLAAVRRMFEECDVFVFTLGLTEGWVSNRDEAVFPLDRGVTGSAGPREWYRPQNFTVAEMYTDLTGFVDKLRAVNQSVKIILTVSPVPLIATFEHRHVLTSTIYSKCALRVVAEMVTKARDGIVYFPSYEIITGPQSKSCFFEDDLREVTAEGVTHVMDIFKKHFIQSEVSELTHTSDTPFESETGKVSQSVKLAEAPVAPPDTGGRATQGWSRLEEIEKVICDEEVIVRDLDS